MVIKKLDLDLQKLGAGTVQELVQIARDLHPNCTFRVLGATVAGIDESKTVEEMSTGQYYKSEAYKIMTR